MIKDRMETRTLSEEDLHRILNLMQEFGSIAYSMDRARAFVAAAKRDLDLFEDGTSQTSPVNRRRLYGDSRSVSRPACLTSTPAC